MDPLTIIVTALVAGAAAGGKDAASSAVKDLYLAISSRIAERAGRDAETVPALARNESVPGGNIPALEALIRRNELAPDQQLNQAARRLLAEVDGATLAHVRNQLDLAHAQGVQVGDGNTQTNTFNA
ncbi:hypothetical protein [Nocardia sp. NPDC057030]|uniref:hypothetical protein n=1 Tax=unclassified Nocardia TaxID=2637762 RepID=UPI003640C6D6